MKEHITTGDKFHHQEKFVEGLERGHQICEEVTLFPKFQHFSLSDDNVQIIASDNLLLTHHLDCTNIVCGNVFSKKDFSKGTMTNLFYKLEIFKTFLVDYLLVDKAI